MRLRRKRAEERQCRAEQTSERTTFERIESALDRCHHAEKGARDDAQVRSLASALYDELQDKLQALALMKRTNRSIAQHMHYYQRQLLLAQSANQNMHLSGGDGRKRSRSI